jgi:hypothetical protein
MKTDRPLLVSLAEASFQLSLPVADIEELVASGDLISVLVRGQRLIVFESLTALVRRKRKALRDACVGCSRNGGSDVTTQRRLST